ncbi:hypothetical protein J8F10_36540 [Gemmata sp. G18]|uniref:Uncharacterized protein n=1 Tax=Gemmata palustris TaxID=2822762 RepID=A0ABS5C545_9BACT|nr:hypothetical protein [Gemmata palustris]MBP3960762.1 hypothetical protein [Gemmata palustris]
MGALAVVVILVLVSTAVGALAKILNNMQEASNTRRLERERYERAGRTERARNERDNERAERPSPRASRSTNTESTSTGSVRAANSDMDRFLAEIDRLRRKAGTSPSPPQPGSSAPVAPVVQPIKPPTERPRSRVVADLADTAAASSAAAGFSTSPQAPTRSAPIAGQIEELPVAQVLRPSSSTGAPATKVTRFFNRPRPTAKTNFGKNLTALLGSGQGVAMAVVLQEILGPPKAKKNANAEKQ